MGRPISSIGRWMAANVKDQVCSHAKHRLRCISASHGKPRLGPARLLPADGTHRSCTVAPLPSLNCQSSTHCSDPTGSSVRSSDLCTPSPSALAGRPSPVGPRRSALAGRPSPVGPRRSALAGRPSPIGAFGLTKRILPRIGQPARARTAAAPASEAVTFYCGKEWRRQRSHDGTGTIRRSTSSPPPHPYPMAA
jgi:hypothetical protein